MNLPDRKTGRPPHPTLSHVAGWTDLIGTAVKESTPRIQRIHLQIAETVFTQVDRFAPAQPAVYVTRTLHGWISGISYGTVAYSGAGMSRLARQYFRQPKQPAAALMAGQHEATDPVSDL